MSEENKSEETKGDATLDKVLSCLDDLRGGIASMHHRMDAFEAKHAKKDSEEEKEDSSAEEAHKEEGKEIKKLEKEAKEDGGKNKIKVRVPKMRMDSEEEEKEDSSEEKEEKADQDEAEKEADKKHREEMKEEKKDSEEEKVDAHADSIASLQATIAELRRDLDRRAPKAMTDDDFHKMSQVQAKADTVFQAFGDSAPRPMSGETVDAYRRRLASGLKEKSPKLKDTNLYSIKDEAAFTFMEDQIYSDAMQAALQPADLPEGQLREIKTRDTTGRVISTFVGEPRSWMRPHRGRVRRVSGFDKSQGRR